MIQKLEREEKKIGESRRRKFHESGERKKKIKLLKF
jgi:hypothetical protein